MDPITVIEGEELDALLAALRPLSTVYRLRVHQGSDGRLKYKINEGTWTYWVGEDDSA